MQIDQIQRFARNSKRFQEIAAVFDNHGLAGWLEDSAPEWVQNMLRSTRRERLPGYSSHESWRLSRAIRRPRNLG